MKSLHNMNIPYPKSTLYTVRCPHTHTHTQFLIKSINDLFNKSYTYMVKGKKKGMLRHDVPQLKGGKNQS